MLSRSQLFVIVGAGALVWALALIVRGEDVSINFLLPFNVVVGFLAFLLSIYERWLWKWWPFAILVSMPNLNGTWLGTFKSDFTDNAGARYPETTAFLVIHQTLSTLSVCLMTDRSSSALLYGNVERDKTSAYLSGIYKAASRALDQAENPPHMGAMVLRVIGKPVRTLDGSYWTDRASKGELLFSKRVGEWIETYQEGLDLFELVPALSK